jgi:hypothetical protein
MTDIVFFGRFKGMKASWIYAWQKWYGVRLVTHTRKWYAITLFPSSSHRGNNLLHHGLSNDNPILVYEGKLRIRQRPNQAYGNFYISVALDYFDCYCTK